MRTKSRLRKFSAVLIGQPMERHIGLFQDLQCTLVAVWLTQAQGRRRSCHSSAESETYAAASATRDAVLITTFFMATSMSHYDVFVFGFISCKRCTFSKRCRSCETFELQSSLAARFCDAETFTCQSSDGPGALNPADIATKRLSAARLESLCYFLGIWRGNNLEGANDPGNIFRHVTNQREQGYSQSQINLLISAVSVLTQLQGCSGAMDAVTAENNFGVVFLVHMAAWVGWLPLCSSTRWTSPEKF